MAKVTQKKLTKAQLLREMDEILQDLNLLKSALEADQSRKQEDLARYAERFYELINKGKK